MGRRWCRSAVTASDDAAATPVADYPRFARNAVDERYGTALIVARLLRRLTPPAATPVADYPRYARDDVF